MKKMLCGLMLSVLMASPAYAGFMIEPFVGYEMGDTSGAGNYDVTGSGFGARLGYSMLGLMFGAEYSKSSVTLEPSTGNDVDADLTDLGVFVGYEFPIMIRAYATYFVDSKAETSSEFTGGGTRIGIGFTGLPFVCINFEMISRTYDENDGTSMPTDLKMSTNMISVSLPLP